MKDRLVKVCFASVCFWLFLLWCKSQLKWLPWPFLVLHAYGCAQVLDPKFQSDSFSKDQIITKIELKRSLQVNDSPDFLPIDVEASPDANKHIVLMVPEQDSKAGTKSTAIDALKPILTGSYSYAAGKVDEVNKFFGKDFIDFSMTNPIELKVFSEANTQETYTIFIKTKVFSEAPPEAFNIKITTEVNKQIIDVLPDQQIKTYQTFTGAYAYADVNFDQEASTTFGWHRGDTPTGTFKKIKGINLQNYSTRSQDGGKYLKFAVTPVADSGMKNGKPHFSLPIGPVKPLTGLALAQSRIKIVEIGRAIDNNDQNDYIILHNQENFPVSTRGLYIGRDSGCTLAKGWTSYDVLPDFLMPAQGYYLISKPMNTIGADHSSWGGLSLNDCIALVASSVKPTHAISSYVIDFVAFGTAKVKGEGGTNAPALMKRKILRRKNSCSNNVQDTDNNAADFEFYDPSDFIKQTRSSRVKNCAAKLPPNPLKIAEIGNEYDSATKNDYIILHNPSNQPVSLNGLYIGRDEDCTISSGFSVSAYKALPNGGVVAANGYYLVARSGNNIGADDSMILDAIGENYCVVLANSSKPPTSPTNDQVIDFVAFGTTTIKGEGGTNAPALMLRKILRRKNSCSNNVQDTDNNAADFELFDPSGFIKEIRSSRVKNCAAKLPPNPLKIAEIGNKYAGATDNDYIILHNPSNQPVSLNGLYIGRDSSCTISSGFSAYNMLPNGGVVAANGYYLVVRARSSSTMQADSEILDSIGKNDCVVLANSSKPPTSPTNDQVIDFVAFGATTTKGEGGTNAPALGNGEILRRKKTCEQNNQANDSDNNINDFDLLTSIPTDHVIRNSTSRNCISISVTPVVPPPTPVVPPPTPVVPPVVVPPPVVPPTPTPMPTPVGGSTTLVIAEVGNNINDNTNNDYIVLYNKSNAPIDLSNYYIGGDSGCNFSNGWTTYVALSGTIVAHGYFLISNSSNSLSPNFTWSGALSSNYCVVLANSATKPNSATDSNVIDFVSFKENIGEGRNRAGVLSDKKYFRRNGTCLETDTNDNANDFSAATTTSTSSYTPRNSGTAVCP